MQGLIMTVLTNFFINQPQFQHFITLQMLSIYPGGQTYIIPALQTAKLMWRDWFCSMPPGHLCQLEAEQPCPWQSRWTGEKQSYCACCFTVVLGLPAAGNFAQRGRFMLWCCQIGWLTGCSLVVKSPWCSWVDHSGANPSACSDCYKLILKKK